MVFVAIFFPNMIWFIRLIIMAAAEGSPMVLVWDVVNDARRHSGTTVVHDSRSFKTDPLHVRYPLLVRQQLLNHNLMLHRHNLSVDSTVDKWQKGFQALDGCCIGLLLLRPLMVPDVFASLNADQQVFVVIGRIQHTVSTHWV